MATTTPYSFNEIQKRLAELEKERQELEVALQSKRGEELKVLADAYAKKLQAGGFTIAEGVQALEPYDTSKRKRAPRGSLQKQTPPYVAGTIYQDPAGKGKDWKGGDRGAQPNWLREAVAGLSGDALATKYESLQAR